MLSTMRFLVLGPLEVVSDDGGSLPLGGRKQRRLLAVLLLHANRLVERGRLIDSAWGDGPPPSAQESLDVYVYRLRRLLGHDRIARRDGGYLLRVEPGELDAADFERLKARAGESSDVGEHRAATAAFEQALGLWRGTAWTELDGDPGAIAEAHRLDELRVSANEALLESRLALGAGSELVADLEQLQRENPLRERAVAALMIALYRAGRHSDALDAFQAARRRLIDELGLEPSPRLYDLQQQILTHDPDLGSQAFSVRAAPSQPRIRGSLRAAVAVGVLAVSLGIGVIVLAAGASGPAPGLRSGTSGVVALSGGRVELAASLGSDPTAIAAGAGSIWVADAGDDSVTRLDPTSGATVDRITVGGEPVGIVVGAGAIWIADAVGDKILRIDPISETVTQTIALNGSNPSSLAFGGGTLWVADGPDRTLSELDPSTGELLRTSPLPVTPSAIAYGAGAVWIAGYDNAEVLKLDAGSGAVTGRVRVGTGPSSLAFAAGDLWVANSLDSTVSRIGPATLTVRATISIGGDPDALAAGQRSVWVANAAGTIAQIDTTRNAVSRTVPVGGTPTTLISVGARVWAGVAAGGSAHRGGTMVIDAVGPFPSIDPAFFHFEPTPQYLGFVYDTLVTFDHTGGADGLRLVPDLALNLPLATDSGRTYAFRLRPGIRYSNGVPLRATDIRRAFERLFRLGSPGANYYEDIIGAQACTRKPAICNLSRGIVVNDAAGTVVFHLAAPDPEFLDALTEQDYTAPVPAGTPERDMGLRPFPGTGPYRIARSSEYYTEFVRNPFFREWSHAAQPAGYPDVIKWRIFNSNQAAADTVVRDGADWLQGVPPLSVYHQIAIQSPTRLHSEPLFSVAFFSLNTHLAPFDNVLVRRALNLAINRDQIAAMWGGAAFATPICQPLAPGLPGFRRYCPYTKQPNPSGGYSRPNLRLARQLVNRSGTIGQHITVWGIPVGPYPPPQVSAYVAAVLRSLGYRTTVRLVPFQNITNAMQDHFQISTDGDWQADYPDPSSYFPEFFGCNGSTSNGYVCDSALDREMRQAAALEQREPTAANALWTKIDHTLTNRAYWVPTVNNRNIDLTSQRLGDYQFNPEWGFLPDQAWVR